MAKINGKLKHRLILQYKIEGKDDEDWIQDSIESDMPINCPFKEKEEVRIHTDYTDFQTLENFTKLKCLKIDHDFYVLPDGQYFLVTTVYISAKLVP